MDRTKLADNGKETWPEEFRSEAVQSHALRPGFTAKNWPRLVNSLLKHVMPGGTLEWFDAYRAEFVKEIMNGDDTGANMTARSCCVQL